MQSYCFYVFVHLLLATLLANNAEYVILELFYSCPSIIAYIDPLPISVHTVLAWLIHAIK